MEHAPEEHIRNSQSIVTGGPDSYQIAARGWSRSLLIYLKNSIWGPRPAEYFDCGPSAKHLFQVGHETGVVGFDFGMVPVWLNGAARLRTVSDCGHGLKVSTGVVGCAGDGLDGGGWGRDRKSEWSGGMIGL
jgi:hypothetical protein